MSFCGESKFNSSNHMKIQKVILFTLSFVLGHFASAHSEAFKPAFVDTVVTPYLQIQTSLAGDDLAHSKRAATAFLVAMQAAPDAANAKTTVDSLQQSAIQLKGAGNLKTARAAFLALSQELQTLVEHIGTTGKTPLFVAHCSMAFDGKGGSWLQANKEVLNPYYGSMMLHCGSVKEQIVD